LWIFRHGEIGKIDLNLNEKQFLKKTRNNIASTNFSFNFISIYAKEKNKNNAVLKIIAAKFKPFL
jgi:hypothetical protein